MAFSLGDRSTRSTINVTPLIDVLLVLLIIFMVIQPSVLQGISALTPSASSSSAASESPSLVINVENAAAAPAYRIDGQAFDSRELAGALQEQIQQRGRRTVFIVGSGRSRLRSGGSCSQCSKGSGCRNDRASHRPQAR